MKDKEKKILNKKTVKIIVVIISLLICFFGIIPLFINFLVNTTNPFGIGFINQENKETWINFFGSIIGGGLTLFGVWWTINNQEKQRKKDLAIQYKPLFELNNIKLKNDSRNDMLRLLFNIQNIGRGEAYKFKIECNKDLFNSEDEEENNCFRKDIILPNDVTDTEFCIQIHDYDGRKNIIINDNDTQNILTYNIKITITFSDMSCNLRKQIVHIPASYNKIEDKCRINYSDISYELTEE